MMRMLPASCLAPENVHIDRPAIRRVPPGRLASGMHLRFSPAIPLLLAGTALVAAESGALRPNVVIILCDDLGYGDIEPYGQRSIRTPALARMAAEGMRFTDGYASAPVCTPSRACFYTGRHAAASTVKENGDEPRFPDGEVLGQTLGRAGYECGIFGKWGLTTGAPAGTPTGCGFTTFLGYHTTGAAHESFPLALDASAGPRLLPGNEGGRQSTWAPGVYFEEMLRFVEQPRNGPFLAVLATTVPHPGHEVPAEALAATAARFKDTNDFAGNALYHPHPAPTAGYAAQIELLDQQVGRLLGVLAERNLERRTLVIFTSDNGPGGAGGADLKRLGSTGGLRGGKRSLQEGGIRVPFLAWWPGTIAAGVTTDRTVAGYDIYPTLCAGAGVATPTSVTGTSFLPTLLGKAQEAAPAHAWEYRAGQAVRAGPLKILRTKRDAPWQLFDLAADRGESRDLAAERPDEVARIAALAEAGGLLSKP
jgi:arylsulfatase A-like enzyme